MHLPLFLLASDILGAAAKLRCLKRYWLVTTCHGVTGGHTELRKLFVRYKRGVVVDSSFASRSFFDDVQSSKAEKAGLSGSCARSAGRRHSTTILGKAGAEDRNV